jgi:hypothetical protein
VVILFEKITSGLAMKNLVYAIGIAGAIKIAYELYSSERFEPVGQRYVSMWASYLMSFRKQPNGDNKINRTRFNNLHDIDMEELDNHTHGKSAAVRNKAKELVKLYGKSIAKEPYFVQQSAADARDQDAGCRTYYWAKDMNVDYKEFAPVRGQFLALMDVDYYMDVPRLLARYPGMYAISTFQPSAVAYSGDSDYNFTFNEKDEVTYVLGGGSRYSHKVWSYSSDIIVAVDKRWGGLWYDMCVYNVERRQIDPHHQLILLVPLRVLSSPLVDLTYWIQGNHLERLKVAMGGYLRMDVVCRNDMKTSTGKAGHFTCATIPTAQDSAIAIKARLYTVALSEGEVAGIVNLKGNSPEVIMLLDFHRNAVDNRMRDRVFPQDKSVQKFQYDPPSYNPEAKSSVQPFMRPLVADGCYAPDKTRSNDQRMVDGRVKEVKAPELKLTKFLVTVITEFVTLLVPEEGILIPTGVEEVYERQNRPNQRILLDKGGRMGELVMNKIKSFMKAESYQKVTDPRVISTVPPINKLEYSKFVYAFDAILRKQKWYAFGKNPIQIAERVAQICSMASEIAQTDFSRFDGRVSKILRMVESLAMVRAFKVDYTDHLVELMNTQKDQVATTTFGVKYSTGESRLSGSAETANFNTLSNAFVAFLAFRRTRGPNGYYTAQEAWEKLGIYGGDDGLTADIDGDTYIYASKMVGQELELEPVKRGKPGVKFLAREYSPYVWYGDPNSMCDPGRQLAKLHTTHCMSHTIDGMRKLREKCYGLIVTDRNTPVLGELAKVVLALSKSAGVELTNELGVANYWSKYETEVNFPNANPADWMNEAFRRNCPKFDMELFREWLAKVAKGEAHILEPPLCQVYDPPPVTTKADVMVSGKLVKAEPPVGQSKKPARPATKNKTWQAKKRV